MNSRISSTIAWVALFGLSVLLVQRVDILTSHGSSTSRGLRHRILSSVTKLIDAEMTSHRRAEIIRGDGYEFSTVPRGVVILPGPHKTGSSSVQKNMVMWTRSRVLNGWTWPLLSRNLQGKNYLKLVKQLWTGEEGVQEEYARLFRDYWAEGKNLVIGSELMDIVTMDPENRIIDGLINMMPWNQDSTHYGSNGLITVSVTYRSPRAAHLVSVWHQIGKPGVSLREFILTLEDDSRQWHASLNPLGVAEKFAQKGLSTVIIDSSGLHRDNLDVSMVVACEVLEAFCKNNTLVGLKESPTVKNVKFGRGEMDVDEGTLNEIGDVLKLMDASYCHLSRATNVKVLHGLDVFTFCEDGKVPERAIDSREAVRRIKDIVSATSQSM